MTNLSRRNFLLNTALGGAALGLTACTTATSGDTTTITINVSEITSDTTAALNIVKTVLAFTGVPAAVVTVADEVISAVETALTAWNAYSSGSSTITFTKGSAPAVVTSVLTALNTGSTELAAVVQSEASTLGGTLTSEISAVASDVASVAAVISSAVSTVTAAFLAPRSAGAAPGSPQWRAAEIAAIRSRHGV
ncbi:twin-arginine translocation signal domain-containing protein [Acetobacter oeni]|uniref:Twin-arginine translocation signal domain-containing protein n=1 Tax=Acetobacter oeni TaxID=304077 RepID=A0A511XFV8_9PROT|nr:twin-arginine translocation signal domain-containing protein [Acetobacter oeni]MBB3882251.1 hypothetical protein [Acetobacter oeni]NHO18005.1 twin-arginine translocation signal domain-containing protein [Acetobacter oeni]GBR01212.1 hypothetical protein AA21952_0352 [Acetobacter oeni LMG 21952]GEN61832.1 hypothetical protein AOE01nite_00560 [Acetobacter oeni]